MHIKAVVILAALAFSFALTGCRKDVRPAPAAPGKVVPTAAYTRFFGTPPAEKGTAYPFVIYFPSAKSPGKVVPFPFISFDEPSMPKVAVQRLLTGMELGSYRGEFLPLSAGSRLLTFNSEKGMAVANFSRETFAAADQESEKAVARAIGLTLRQFSGVTQVSIEVDGRHSELSKEANKADDAAVQQPSPPRLVSLTAMRDKGAKEAEEVDAFFDRPVDVKELTLLSEDGKPFAGQMYHSVFDMAGVLKPKVPSQFKEGMRVKVRWKVVDKVGREAAGEDFWPLQVRQHEE